MPLNPRDRQCQIDDFLLTKFRKPAWPSRPSLSISTLAGGTNRKSRLLALTGLMALSGANIALAPNYAVYRGVARSVGGPTGSAFLQPCCKLGP